MKGFKYNIKLRTMKIINKFSDEWKKATKLTKFNMNSWKIF